MYRSFVCTTFYVFTTVVSRRRLLLFGVWRWRSIRRTRSLDILVRITCRGAIYVSTREPLRVMCFENFYNCSGHNLLRQIRLVHTIVRGKIHYCNYKDKGSPVLFCTTGLYLPTSYGKWVSRQIFEPTEWNEEEKGVGRSGVQDNENGPFTEIPETGGEVEVTVLSQIQNEYR